MTVPIYLLGPCRRESVSGKNYSTKIETGLACAYNGSAVGSGRKLYALSGIINTPQAYNSTNYPNDAVCEWRIYAPENYLIDLW